MSTRDGGYEFDFTNEIAKCKQQLEQKKAEVGALYTLLYHS